MQLKLLMLMLLLVSGCAHSTNNERLIMAAGLTEGVALSSVITRPEDRVTPIVFSSISIAFIITYFITQEADVYYQETKI